MHYYHRIKFVWAIVFVLSLLDTNKLLFEFATMEGLSSFPQL